jgi:hypothetical protein
VTARATTCLIVFLDQLLARIRAERVGPEAGDPERSPNRPQVDSRDRDRLDLV